MAVTLEGVEPSKTTAPKTDAAPGRGESLPDLSTDDKAVVAELVRTARSRGVALTGPDGLLKYLTKQVIEAALDEETTEHLGYGKPGPVGHNSGNSRHGPKGL